jgi:hypothetical protein
MEEDSVNDFTEQTQDTALMMKEVILELLKDKDIQQAVADFIWEEIKPQKILE